MSARARILIVDDSHTTRGIIKKILKPLNAEFLEAVNGREALDRALSRKFDIIVSDVDMPEMDGIELCRRLKESSSTRGTPVVMVSSFSSDTDIEKGFQAGASAYIPKEAAQELLYEKVSGFISRAAFNQNRYVLVVDDSPVICRILKDGLEQNGFQVATAANGRSAINIVRQRQPDIIITDIEMPEMDGFALYQALADDPALSSIPFVVMSVKSEKTYTKRMLEYGAAAYISKPFNIDQLVIIVDRILSDQFRLLLKEKERLDSERNSMLATIASLVSAIEARDAYTKGHSDEVCEIVTGMLSMIGANPEDIENVRIGCKLHDIGKIGVPDDILLKPDSLTQEEYEKIKQHPVIGTNILKTIPSLSKSLPIVKHHHERMDGKGYPSGLKGSKIPLWARLIAVADTYNALTSDRPYRKGMPRDKALQIIMDVRDTQLCPECVSVFSSWMDSKKVL